MRLRYRGADGRVAVFGLDRWRLVGGIDSPVSEGAALPLRGPRILDARLLVGLRGFWASGSVGVKVVPLISLWEHSLTS